MKWRKAMHWMLGVSGVMAGTVLVGVGLLVGLLAVLAWDMVAIEELKRVPSPDGTYSAILEVRDGGATTDTMYHVYLHYEDGSSYDDSERVFLAEHTDRLQLKWLAPDVLSITQIEPVERERIWLQVLRKNQIDIRYNDSLLPAAAASP